MSLEIELVRAQGAPGGDAVFAQFDDFVDEEERRAVGNGFNEIVHREISV